MVENNRKQQQQQRTTENTTVLADLNRGGSEMCLGACAVQKELFEKMIIQSKDLKKRLEQFCSKGGTKWGRVKKRKKKRKSALPKKGEWNALNELLTIEASAIQKK